jgi:glycosyltransferase involved in cell wall biosynthesis
VTGGTPRPPRALLVVENLSVPFDRRVWQESLALRGGGWEVTVVCPRGADRDREPEVEIDGVRILRYRPRESGGGALGFAREYGVALWRSGRLAARVGTVDVVHLCNPPDLLFALALPRRLRGAAVIFDQHDLAPEIYEARYGRRDAVHRVLLRLERCSYRTADAVLVTNESQRAVAVGRGAVPPDRVFVVRNAPPLERFRRGAPDPALRQGAPHLLCYVGMMGPQDGVDYALRSLARLREERTDWHAVFAGSGDALPGLRRLSADLELDGLVSFPGLLGDADLLRYLSTADVGLAPEPRTPLNEASTMIKVMEYMALGCPVVAFDLRETRVSAGEAAVYATPNDEREFAGLISRLLDDPDDRRRRGALGRERVEGELSWERSTRTLLEAYAAATAARRGA